MDRCETAAGIAYALCHTSLHAQARHHSGRPSALVRLGDRSGRVADQKARAHVRKALHSGMACAFHQCAAAEALGETLRGLLGLVCGGGESLRRRRHPRPDGARPDRGTTPGDLQDRFRPRGPVPGLATFVSETAGRRRLGLLKGGGQL